MRKVRGWAGGTIATNNRRLLHRAIGSAWDTVSDAISDTYYAATELLTPSSPVDGVPDTTTQPGDPMHARYAEEEVGRREEEDELGLIDESEGNLELLKLLLNSGLSDAPVDNLDGSLSLDPENMSPEERERMIKLLMMDGAATDANGGGGYFSIDYTEKMKKIQEINDIINGREPNYTDTDTWGNNDSNEDNGNADDNSPLIIPEEIKNLFNGQLTDKELQELDWQSKVYEISNQLRSDNESFNNEQLNEQLPGWASGEVNFDTNEAKDQIMDLYNQYKDNLDYLKENYPNEYQNIKNNIDAFTSKKIEIDYERNIPNGSIEGHVDYDFDSKETRFNVQFNNTNLEDKKSPSLSKPEGYNLDQITDPNGYLEKQKEKNNEHNQDAFNDYMKNWLQNPKNYSDAYKQIK